MRESTVSTFLAVTRGATSTEACVRCGMFCADIELTPGVLICNHCIRILAAQIGMRP